MEFWYYFWLVSFAVSGAAFAAIAVVASVRGVADLRAMIDALRRHQEPPK